MITKEKLEDLVAKYDELIKNEQALSKQLKALSERIQRDNVDLSGMEKDGTFADPLTEDSVKPQMDAIEDQLNEIESQIALNAQKIADRLEQIKGLQQS
jgi:predicted  nucleic acid-binding Zn-ribbon protein